MSETHRAIEAVWRIEAAKVIATLTRRVGDVGLAETDWRQIAALYDALAQLAPSPVVELNQAAAVGMAFGPAAGLGRLPEARMEFTRAASLTRNVRERTLLIERAAACRTLPPPGAKA